MRVLALGLLAGCPYILGPPTVSDAPVTDADTDTDTDADTDADADTDTSTAPTGDTSTVAPTGDTSTVTGDTSTVTPTGDTSTVAPTGDTSTVAPTGDTSTVTPTGDTSTVTPTGDTGLPPTDPELLTASVSLVPDALVVRFTAADPDGDLDGGTLELDDGATTTPYVLATAGAVTWDPITGAGTVTLPEPASLASCAGWSRAFDLVVEDLAGHRSAPRAAAITLEDFAHVDAAPDPDPLGVVDRSAVVCGTTGNNDVDSVSFQAADAGLARFTLLHQANDIDVRVFDGAGNLLVQDQTAANPSAVTWTLGAGATYRLEVERVQNGAGGGDWAVVVSE